MKQKWKHLLTFQTFVFALSTNVLFSISVQPYKQQIVQAKQVGQSEVLCQRNFLRKGNTVFDVGANVGKWTLNAFKRQPNLNVYAFEPIPNVAKKLKKNLRKRGVHIFQIAFDQSPQIRTLYVFEKSALSGFWDREVLKNDLNLKSQQIEVETQTIDDFCQKHGIHKIDYLKIDTEGAEFAVIKGAERMIENLQILLIQFEYGGAYRDSNTTLEEVYYYLHDRGYEIFYQALEGLIHLCKWSETMENFQWCNCIAVHSTMLDKFNLSCCW